MWNCTAVQYEIINSLIIIFSAVIFQVSLSRIWVFNNYISSSVLMKMIKTATTHTKSTRCSSTLAIWCWGIIDLDVTTSPYHCSLRSSKDDNDTSQLIIVIKSHVKKFSMNKWRTCIDLSLTNELHCKYSITRSLIAVTWHGWVLLFLWIMGFPWSVSLTRMIKADSSPTEDVRFINEITGKLDFANYY